MMLALLYIMTLTSSTFFAVYRMLLDEMGEGPTLHGRIVVAYILALVLVNGGVVYLRS